MSLKGKRILLTRPKHQVTEMAQQLRDLGAEVICMPALEIVPLRDTRELDRALRELPRYDWVVLTSVNGVEAIVQRLDALGITRDELRHRKLAVIGPATAQALAEAVREPDLVPDEFVAEAIVEKLGDVSGQRFLLARADRARKDLAEILVARGAQVDEVAVYHIVEAALEEPLPEDAPDYIVLTSSAGAQSTFELLRQNGHENYLDARLACIGPITAETVRQQGFIPHIVAREFTAHGLIEALTTEASLV